MSSPITVLAPAKINLFLHVGDKRAERRPGKVWSVF
jgi:4-diphosphocytidyl-2C-methyl-D-erythritol kinase